MLHRIAGQIIARTAARTAGQTADPRTALLITLRAALITLALSWAIAGLVAGLYAAGRASDIQNAHVTLDPATPLRDDVLRGALLPFLQGGLVCGFLTWQAGRATKQAGIAAGIRSGVVVAAIDLLISLTLGTPLLFEIALTLLIVSAGVYGSYAGRDE